MQLKSSAILLGCSALLSTAAAIASASPVSIFDISQPTHAIVDNKTNVYPCCGADNSNTFSSAYIYNVFGAANTGVEGTGDMIFEDGHATDFIDFHTAQPVNLTAVSLSVGAEATDSDGPRGVISWTFQQYSDSTYTTPVGSAYNFTSAQTATTPSNAPMSVVTAISNGQYFQITMTTNATYGNGGLRVLSGGLAGYGSVAPEPASLSLIGLCSLGLLARRRRN